MDPTASNQVVAELGYSPAVMYFLAIFFSILPALAVALRVKSRHSVHVPLEADDYMIFPALAFTVATGVLMIVGTVLRTLGQHTQIDADGNPVIDGRLGVFLGTTFGNQLSTVLAIGFTKYSVLLFYRRIFKGRIFNIVTILLITLVVAWTLAFFFANLFECVPISVNWTGTGGAPPPICINETPMYYAEAYSDVGTDFLILITPIPMIWRLEMATARKIAVSGVFLLGALTILASVARLVVYYNVGQNLNTSSDISYFLTPIVFWPMIECSLGVVGACLPTLWPLFKSMSLRRLYGKYVPKSRFSTWSGKGSQSIPFKVSSDDSSSIYSTDSRFGGRQSPGIGFKERADYTSYIVQPAYHVRGIQQPSYSPLQGPSYTQPQPQAPTYAQSQRQPPQVRPQPRPQQQPQSYVQVHKTVEVQSIPRAPAAIQPTTLRVGHVPIRSAVLVQAGWGYRPDNVI